MGWCPKCDKRYPNTMAFCPTHGEALVAPPENAADPFLGMVLDNRYQIETLIGLGAMGRVYRAKQINVDRDVAVKILNAAASQNSEIVTRFEAEAKIISRLRHPNTLKLLDFGHCLQGQLFIVIELLQGIALEDETNKGHLKPLRVLGILRQVFDALSEAHEEGIVHRDLKPANIMLETVGGSEIVKVVDFGIAKVMSGVNVTATGRVVGTPAYMSPEQVEGIQITHSSDLYSMGVVAYECLWGKLPFEATTAVGIMLKHIKETPPRPALFGASGRVPKEIEDFVFSLLEKSPAQRPATALVARKAVERLERELLTRPPGTGPIELIESPRSGPTDAQNQLGVLDTQFATDDATGPADVFHIASSVDDLLEGDSPSSQAPTESMDGGPASGQQDNIQDSAPMAQNPRSGPTAVEHDATRTSDLFAVTLGTTDAPALSSKRRVPLLLVGSIVLILGGVAYHQMKKAPQRTNHLSSANSPGAQHETKDQERTVRSLVVPTVKRTDSGVKGSTPKVPVSDTGVAKEDDPSKQPRPDLGPDNPSQKKISEKRNSKGRKPSGKAQRRRHPKKKKKPVQMHRKKKSKGIDNDFIEMGDLSED